MVEMQNLLSMSTLQMILELLLVINPRYLYSNQVMIYIYLSEPIFFLSTENDQQELIIDL